MRRILLATCLAAIAVALTACSLSPPDSEPDIGGPVSQVTESGPGSGSFLVEETGVDGGSANAAVVRVDEGTTILLEDGDGYSPGDFAAIGGEVHVWFEGPVAESWPLQATAGTVVVRERG